MTIDRDSHAKGRFNRALSVLARAIQSGFSKLIGRINGVDNFARPNQRKNGNLHNLEKNWQSCSHIRIGLANEIALPKITEKQIPDANHKQSLITADDVYCNGIGPLQYNRSPTCNGKLFDIGKLAFRCHTFKITKRIIFYAGILCLGLFSIGTAQADNWFDLTWSPNHWVAEDSKTVTGMSNNSATRSTFPDILTATYRRFIYNENGERYGIKVTENGKSTKQIWGWHTSGVYQTIDSSYAYFDEEEGEGGHECHGKYYSGFIHHGTYGHWILDIQDNGNGGDGDIALARGKIVRKLYFCPNKEAIASNLAVGESATLTLQVQVQTNDYYVWWESWSGVKETENLTLTIERQAPEVSPVPIIAGVDKAFADDGNQKAFANSENHVNLKLNFSPDPVTVQYQLSTSELFDVDVIDRSIVMGGGDQLLYPVDIMESTLLESDNYRHRIYIRVIDIDGDDGPNEYRVSSGDFRNKLTMVILHGAVPTLTMEAESVYSDELFGTHGHFLGYFTIITEPPIANRLTAVVRNEAEGATTHGPETTFAANSPTLRYRAVSNPQNYDVITLELAEDVNTPALYKIGTPSSAIIYKSLPTKPGVTLSIVEDSVKGGESFTLTAETTHPVAAIDGLKVLVAASDVGSRIAGTVLGEIKIDKDSTQGSIIVSTNRNTRGEEDTISFSVTDSLSYVVNPVVGSDSVKVRAPTLTIIDPPTTVAETDGTLDFNLMLDVPVNQNVTVSTSVTSDSTAGTGDYTLPPSPLTISSGSNLDGSIPITITNDSVYERDETIVVEFTATNAVFSGNVRTHRILITITDEDDKPEISFKSTSLTVAEGGTIDLTLVSTFESASPYSIGYTLTNATGNFLELPAGATESNRSVNSSFALDSTSQMLEQALSIATRTANQLDEGNGEITVVLDTPDGAAPYTIADSAKTATVTVTNVGTTTLPTITVTESSSSVAESTGATLTYTFTLSSSITEDVSIAFAVSPDSTATVDGTAVDYTLGATSPLVISGGDTAVSLVITAAHDTIYEGDETIILDFTSSNAVFSTDEYTHRLTGTITEDDSKPEIQLTVPNAIPVREGGTFELILGASIASEAAYSIGYTLTNTTGNYLEIPVGMTESNRSVDSNFVYSLGALSQTLTITTRTANQLDENDGQITVVLDVPDDSAPYTIDDAAKTVTVSMADAGGNTPIPTITVTESGRSVVEAVGATLTYTFELSSAISEDVSIAYAVSSDSTAESGDYTLGTASPLVISGGSSNTTASLTIAIVDEPVYEGDETIILALASNNAVFSAGVYTHTLTGTITDDEVKPTVSFKSATQNAVEGVSFDLTLVTTGPTESPYSIGYTLTNVTGNFLELSNGATSASLSVDSNFTGNVISQLLEQSLSIALRSANGQPESVGEITVVLDTPASTAPYTIDDSKKTVTVKVVDESEYPTITVTEPTSTDVAESIDTLTYTFTLSQAASGNETITPSLSSDSTAEVEDYTLSPITFTGTTATLTLTIEDDSVYEGDETLVLDLTAANAIFNGSGFTQSLTVGISDNETKPEISFKSATQNAIEGIPFELTLVASVASEATYSIGYRLTNTTGDFIDIPNQETVAIESIDSSFTSQMLEQIVSIATRAANGNPNGQADDPGEVSVVLDTPTDTAPYSIHATKNTVTVTVSDEFALPIITVTEPNNTIAETTQGTLTYTFTLSTSTSGNASITHSVSNDSTAEVNDDYVLSPVAFTGATGTMTIKIEDDSFYEGDERIIVDLTAANAVFSGGGNRHRLTVTITDDETKPVISFKSTTQNAIEGASFNVTLVATGTTESSYAIGYTLTNTMGDFLEISGGGTELNLRVNSSFTSQMLEQELTITTRAANGTPDQEGEITVELDDPSSSALYTVDNTKKTVSVTVEDEAATPIITVTEPSSKTVSENGGTLIYTFTLSKAASGNETITPKLSTTGSTAESEDFELSPIAFNDTTATLTITIEDDQVYEGDETLVLDLTSTNAVFSGGGYTHTLTATITDNDAKPNISFKTATQTVAEGASFDLTLVASLESEAAYSIGYTLTNVTGDFMEIPSGATEATGNVESNFVRNGQALEQVFSIDTRTANGMKDDNGEISVVLDTPDATAPYTIDDAMKTASVSVIDDSVYVISVKAGRQSVTEGEIIDIVIESNPVPREDFDVGLRVTVNDASLAWPVKRSVKFTSGNGTVNLKLSTMSNPNTTGGGTVTVALIKSGTYEVGNPESIQVVKPETPVVVKYSVASSVITSILSNLPPTPKGTSLAPKPTLTISASKGNVAEGDSAVFAISASFASDSDISIRIKLSQSGDFVSGSMDRLVDLTGGNMETVLEVKTDDDQLAELDGRITATIQNGSGYLVGSENTAHVAVSDALDTQHRKNQVSNAMQAVLPNLLAHSTTGTLGIASERVEQAFSDSSATSVELNGKSSAATILRSSGKMLNDSDADWRSIIDDTSFTLALYPDGGASSSATLWGVGDKLSLSRDGTREQQSWDGETHTGHFGFDARIGNGLLTGLAVSVSNTEIDYGSDADSKLSLATLTQGVQPYVGFSSFDGESKMQIVAGYGVNDIDLKQEGYSPEVLTGQYRTVGVSGSSLLYSNSSFGWAHNLELNVVGNAWHAQQSVNSAEGLTDGLQASAGHFRIAVKESNDFHLGVGGAISPSISIGLRGDRRNEEAIFGTEASSEIKYAAFNGLEVTGSGRSILSGLNRVQGWEVGSSLDYDSGNDGEGVLFSMASSWSESGSDVVKSIWESELVGASSDSLDSNGAGSASGEFGFGFEILDGAGLITPFIEVKLSAAFGSEYRVGSRIASNSGIDFELETTRYVPETGTSEHKVNLTGNIKW